MIKNTEKPTPEQPGTPKSGADHRFFAAELAWLLTCPTLLSPKAHPVILTQPLANLPEPVRTENLDQLAKKPEEIEASFHNLLADRRSSRLGIRYEALWQSLYLHVPHYQPLAANLPVRDSQRTLGEYDLLYRVNSPSQEPQFYHQELAIKFYLGKKHSAGDWYDWIGPDKKDQLGRKMELMLNRQMTLADTPEGHQVAQELCPDNTAGIWQKELLLQGYLFYPWQQSCLPPKQSNPNHLRGDWLHFSQLGDYLDTLEEQDFIIPCRQHWLGLEQPQTIPLGDEQDDSHPPPSIKISKERLQKKLSASLNSNEPKNTDNISTHRYRKNSPVLVCGTTASIRPFFVVPDHW